MIITARNSISKGFNRTSDSRKKEMVMITDNQIVTLQKGKLPILVTIEKRQLKVILNASM